MALVCLLLGCEAAWATAPGAAEPKLEARLVPDSALVGSRVDLVLSYRLPEGAHLTPEVQIQGLEGLSVEGIQKTDETIRVGLLLDRLGPFKTGPLSLAYLSREGQTALLTADPVELAVLSNLTVRPEEAQPRPIRGIIPVRSGLMKFLPWVLGGLAVCAAGMCILLWLQRRSGRGSRLRSQVPPHIAAEREIRELASQGLFEQGRVKEFYFRFSEILRRYLERLRGFPAAEYTTQEIALAIQTPEDREILPLLQDADLVKFADLKPMAARKGDDIDAALAYIRETGAVFDRPDEDEGNSPRGMRPPWLRIMGRGEKRS